MTFTLWAPADKSCFTVVEGYYRSDSDKESDGCNVCVKVFDAASLEDAYRIASAYEDDAGND
jgi:hypothetical protein